MLLINLYKTYHAFYMLFDIFYKPVLFFHQLPVLSIFLQYLVGIFLPVHLTH